MAALHSDLAWHRARVLQAGTDWLLLHYLDWGWLARVRLDTVRSLHSTFMDLAWQAVNLKKVNLVGGEAETEAGGERPAGSLERRDEDQVI